MTLFAFLLLVLSEKARAEEPSNINKKPNTEERSINNHDINWLARTIYHESRGESVEGQYAVGIVTVNRVKSGKFPDTIQGVITQKGQFSWYRPRTPEKINDTTSFLKAKSIAKNILEEKGDTYHRVNRRIGNSLYFCESKVKLPRKRRIVEVIGRHKFYI